MLQKYPLRRCLDPKQQLKNKKHQKAFGAVGICVYLSIYLSIYIYIYKWYVSYILFYYSMHVGEYWSNPNIFWDELQRRLLRGADHGPVAHHIGAQLPRLEPSRAAIASLKYVASKNGYHRSCLVLYLDRKQLDLVCMYLSLYLSIYLSIYIYILTYIYI